MTAENCVLGNTGLNPPPLPPPPHWMNPPLPLTGPDTPDSPGAEGHPLHEHHLLCAGRLRGHPRAHQGQDQPTTQPAQPVLRTERKLQKVSLTYLTNKGSSQKRYFKKILGPKGIICEFLTKIRDLFCGLL